MIVLVAVVVLTAGSTVAASAHPHPKLRHWYRTSGAKCVHHFEGSFTANTGNGYYGGFQMDINFQIRWNPRRYYWHGTANNWTKWHQVATVRRAVRAIGWGPWPNTAMMCGLL